MYFIDSEDHIKNIEDINKSSKHEISIHDYKINSSFLFTWSDAFLFILFGIEVYGLEVNNNCIEAKYKKRIFPKFTKELTFSKHIFVKNNMLHYDICYNRMDNEVVIPEGIEVLCNNSDMDMLDMMLFSKVSLPNSLRVLQSRAFDGAVYLKSLDIPESVTMIENAAFNNCRSLEELIFSDSIRYIGSNAVGGCDNLRYVKLPKYAQDYGFAFFSDCFNLECVEFGDDTEIISVFMFGNCVSLSKVKLPSKLKEIYYNAFKNCSSLERIDLPDGLESIQGNVFDGCSSLRELTIPRTVINFSRKSLGEGLDSLRVLNVPDYMYDLKLDNLSPYTEINYY